MTERWKNSRQYLRGGPRLLTAVPVLMVLVYLVFFLSGFFLPGGLEYETTPLYTELPLGVQKKITLTRWDACPAQEKAEIAFSVSDPEMRSDPSYAIACYALHRGREQRISCRAVLETGDRYVLQMELPEDCDALRVDLRDTSEADGEKCTMTADRSGMTRVDSMPVRSEQGYRALELSRKREIQTGELSRILDAEEDLVTRIARLRKRQKELEQEEGLTSAEEAQRQDALAENSRQMESAKGDLSGLREEEKALRESIREIGESLDGIPEEDLPEETEHTGS